MERPRPRGDGGSPSSSGSRSTSAACRLRTVARSPPDTRWQGVADGSGDGRWRGVRRPTSVGARPGLLLDDEVALDGEDAAALAQLEEVDEVRVDVQLVAVLAQPARDAEAQALASVRQPERRVESRHDELAGAAGAAEAGHRVDDLGWVRSFDRPVPAC